MRWFNASAFSVAAKKNGGTAETGRQDIEGNVAMLHDGRTATLNAIAEPRPPQGINAFIAEGFVTLTAVQANQVLLHAEYDRQRKIDKNHVNVLADIMKRGQWAPKDKIDFALLKNELILVNGYHRMSGQVECGKSIEWTIVIHTCRNLEQVRALYYKFDTNTRKRQGSQILAGIDFAAQHDLARQTSTALYNAVPVIASGFSKSIKDRDVLTNRVVDRRVAFAEQYVNAAKVYEGCLAGLPSGVKSKFLSAGIMAVALVTLRYQPLVALDFWKGAAQNDGLKKGDPRLALYNDLISRQMNAGSAIQSIFSPAHAWNAFFEERPLKLIKLPGYKTNVSIAGTPFED